MDYNTSLTNYFVHKVSFCGEYAWRLSDIIQIMERLKELGAIVLGGDILNEYLEYTGESWYYNVDSNKCYQENVTDSIAHAKAYFSEQKNGGSTIKFVTIVTKANDDSASSK